MFSPTVTELPRRLEPISRDTFNDAGRDAPTPGRPSPSNVIELRRSASRAPRPRAILAAA
jgi:hypothetical protein